AACGNRVGAVSPHLCNLLYEPSRHSADYRGPNFTVTGENVTKKAQPHDDSFAARVNFARDAPSGVPHQIAAHIKLRPWRRRLARFPRHRISGEAPAPQG